MDLLVDLIDDYPSRRIACNHMLSKRKRPFLASFCNTIEDHLDRQVGQLFRSLPAVLMELQDDSELIPKKRKVDKGDRSVVSTKDGKFNISLDTSDFRPDDISVKIVGNQLSVSAKHESKSKNSYEFHEMHREFTIPDSVDPDAITSKLSSGGQLTIEAPLKSIKDAPTGRTVSIQREEGSAVQTKDKASETKESKSSQ